MIIGIDFEDMYQIIVLILVLVLYCEPGITYSHSHSSLPLLEDTALLAKTERTGSLDHEEEEEEERLLQQ